MISNSIAPIPVHCVRLERVGVELPFHLYQEHQEHLDRLKAAIPALHERKPAIILGVPLELVTERAIELLKELQLEYKIHPLLEEDEAFAQG